MNPQALAAYIKGWEYILVIIFVFCFVLFWALLNRQTTGEEERLHQDR